ncbi:hypothetical protein FACS1894196_4430 [Clostridia bacterium]|nr:hypothetical protein FACS1894196_4430 [Clostridia bacterium]
MRKGFRLSTNPQRVMVYRRMAIVCPRCGHRVCDISRRSNLEAFDEGDEWDKPPWEPDREPDVFIKCRWCGSELALYHKS